jgi:hypothetical protein
MFSLMRTDENVNNINLIRCILKDIFVGGFRTSI